MSDDDRPYKPEHSKSRKDKLLAGKYAAEARDRAAADAHDELTERVGQLEQVVQRLMRSTRPEPPQPIVWPDLSDDEYAETLGQLREWMRRVLFPLFPSTARVVLACWAQHPFAREALTVAWQTHTAAWTPGADPLLRAQWVAQWRNQLHEQLKGELASCHEGHVNQYPPDPSVIDGQPEE